LRILPITSSAIVAATAYCPTKTIVVLHTTLTNPLDRQLA